MSRPIKQGLDYFPMDVNTDEKIELIEAKHGLVGFGIVVKLFQKIYKNGYYLEWNEERLLLFKKHINVDINLINEVINDCFAYNILNEKIYKDHKVLTSSGIQKRYLNACERRKVIELDKNLIIVDINDINVNINWINDHISTQSKVKESKVKESILTPDQISIIDKFKKWIETDAPSVQKMKEPLTDDQILKIVAEFKREIIKSVFQSMHNCAVLTKKYKSANLTFRNWVKREPTDVKTTPQKLFKSSLPEDYGKV